MRKKAYQISGQTDRRKIAEYLSKDGQWLLALLELVCNTENACACQALMGPPLCMI